MDIAQVKLKHPVGALRGYSISGRSPRTGQGAVVNHTEGKKGAFVVVRDIADGKERKVRPGCCTGA